MTTRFAGSRFLDERRRRRLASESDEPANSAEPSSTRSSSNVSDEPSISTVADGALDLSITKLISPEIWKHWVIGLAVLLVGVGILAGGHYEAEGIAILGPGYSQLFSLATGVLVTSFSTLLLLLSGQMALLIWWVRSQSLQDFAGRYHAWIWISAAWFTFAFTLTTDAHLAFNETVFWFWHSAPVAWKSTIWLVPAVVLGVYLMWALHRDVRECRSSLTMLWLAAGCYLATALFQFPVELSSSQAESNLIRLGTSMCGHLFLFQSMLLHTRHVIYETAEPPELKSNRLLEWLGQIRLPEIRLDLLAQKLKRSSAKKKLRSEQKSEKPRRAKRKVSGTKPVKQTRPEPVDESEEDAAVEELEHEVSEEVVEREEAESNIEEPEKPARRKKRKVNKANRQASEAEAPKRLTEEPLNLKGLSKRERRKLRKERREAQRAAG